MHRKTRSQRIFQYFNYSLLIFLAAICILPMIHVIALSLSSTVPVMSNEVTFWPKGFTFNAYIKALENPQLIKSFWVSIQRVVLGVGLGLLITTLAGYVLARGGGRDGIAGYRFFVGFIVVAFLFNGGLIPTYLLITNMGLYNNLLAIVIPGITNVFYIFLVMNFFKSLPKSMEEAAFIDGANHFQVFYKIYLPLSVPVLATVGLFMLVFEWNEWFMGSIYMQSDNVPLSTFVKSLVAVPDLDKTTVEDIAQSINNRSLNAAQVVFAALPILVIFPFLQKFFTRGIVIGSVKE